MDAFVNFSKATVQYPYDESATSISVVAADAGRFPAAPFNATWWDSTLYPDPSDDPKREIVRVTVIAGATLTITRAQESTVATSKNAVGHVYKIMSGLTAKTLNVDIATLITNPSDPAAMAVATAALTTAWNGTDFGRQAQNTANDSAAAASAASGAAIAAYSIGKTALDTAWVGTGAGAAAYSTARTALDTSWVGTTAASSASGAASASYSVGKVALDTSWVGTGAASASYAVGKAALEAVWAGTTAENLSAPSYGTGSPEGVVDGIQGRTHFDPVPQNLYVKTSPAGITAGWILIF